MLLIIFKLKFIKEISIKKLILSFFVFVCINISVEVLENDGFKLNDLVLLKEVF